MASLELGVKFIPSAGGTADFTPASTVQGFRAASTLTTGKTYRYRAENTTGTEWEYGTGVWNGTVLARTTIKASSTGSKVSFAASPTVGIIQFVEDVLQFDDGMALTSAQQKQARANIGVADQNLIINPDFFHNQRAYASAATLAAGSYGHDRWKGGASGGDYSFTQLAGSTQITIASGKTLIQPVEARDVGAGGTYVLSWTGTAQARAGVNTGTPSGSYAASPLVISGQTANTIMSVEFNAGTLGTVKLEPGAVATSFQKPDYSVELVRCRRFFRIYGVGIAQFQYLNIAMTFSSTIVRTVILLGDAMRAAPTVSLSAPSDFQVDDPAGSVSAVSALAAATTCLDSATVQVTVSGMTSGRACFFQAANTNARVKLEAEL